MKKIELVISADFSLHKIGEERNQRNKSSFITYGNQIETRIKLEIGSSVRPDQYMKKEIKSYIHEFLELNNYTDLIKQYELNSVQMNTLCIERTFIDKVMAVKRHALCGTLNRKVRHIYDIYMLFQRDEIKQFLQDHETLKRLLQITKQTDSYYLQKRNISQSYTP